MKTTDSPTRAFLTIAEAAAEAGISPKRLRTLMAAGVLREGTHFTRPFGLRPRIRRDALFIWLNGQAAPSAGASAARRPHGGRRKLNLELLAGSTRGSRR